MLLTGRFALISRLAIDLTFDLEQRIDPTDHLDGDRRDDGKRKAFDLPVQRDVLAELVAQDHRQKARTCPAPGDDMERCRRLADLLTVAAAELFAHRRSTGHCDCRVRRLLYLHRDEGAWLLQSLCNAKLATPPINQ